MAKYDVFLYLGVHLKVPAVEAASSGEAALRAEGVLSESGDSLHGLIDRTYFSGTRAESLSYSESVDSFKVAILDKKGQMVDGETVDLCSDGKTPYHPAKGALREIIREVAKTNPEKARLAAASIGLKIEGA